MSSAAFTPKELEQLRNSVYRGYQMKPRNYGEEARAYDDWMSDDSAGDQPEFRNQIDFSRYDGSRTGTENLGKPGHDGDVNTSQLWNRVRKDIGIKDVDSENDLRQMFDYVTNYQAKKNEPEATPEATPAPTNEAPPNFVPSDDLVDLAGKVEAGQSGQSGIMSMPGMKTGGDPYKNAIEFGNDANKYFDETYLQQKANEAKLAAKEIGERGLFNFTNFIGKVPELGDPREAFEYYADKINNA